MNPSPSKLEAELEWHTFLHTVGDYVGKDSFLFGTGCQEAQDSTPAGKIAHLHDGLGRQTY